MSLPQMILLIWFTWTWPACVDGIVAKAPIFFPGDYHPWQFRRDIHHIRGSSAADWEYMKWTQFDIKKKKKMISFLNMDEDSCTAHSWCWGRGQEGIPCSNKKTISWWNYWRLGKCSIDVSVVWPDHFSWKIITTNKREHIQM